MARHTTSWWAWDEQHSVRINDQYRIGFVWSPAGPTDVQIVDYH